MKDFLFLAALLAAGTLLRNNSWGLALLVGFVLFLFWLAFKASGSLGLATCLLASGETDIGKIADLSYKKSWEFFRNGWSTGVVMIFGQLLLVCPCFLLLNNFLFSPYLFVYENLKGEAARKRSRDLASGFGWLVLNRTAGIMLAGYAFLILFGVLLYSRMFVLVVLLTLASGIYFSLVQSNFIRLVYEQTLEMQRLGLKSGSGRQKLFTALVILAVVAVYVGIKISSRYL